MFEIDLASEYLLEPGQNIWVRKSAEREIDYSDGDDIENRIIGIIQDAADLSSGSLALDTKISDWPSRYHLSVLRANLLRPVRDFLTGRILEVGAGLGAITRFLGETGADVIALEATRRRAGGAAARCRDLPNVTVVCDALHRFAGPSGFDAIILVGVLEYARIYFPADDDPIDAMLRHVRRLLRPGGKIVLAIENQLGLKYFAGSLEDHISRQMHGIEDLYTEKSAVTFGRAELSHRMERAGFSSQEWFFPFPDYKLPTCVFSEHAFDENCGVDFGPLLSGTVKHDPQRAKNPFFSLEQGWLTVLRNNLAGDLANSFLIVGSDEEIPRPESIVLGHHFSSQRRPEFAKETLFERLPDGRVNILRRRLYPQAIAQCDTDLSMKLADEIFIAGDHWQQRAFRILNTAGWTIDDMAKWVAVWFDALLSHAGLSYESVSAGAKVPGSLFDAIPRNLIIDTKGVGHFFDQEWVWNREVDLSYLFIRGVVNSLTEIDSVALPAPDTPIKFFEIVTRLSASLGLDLSDADFENYLRLEEALCFVSTGKKMELRIEESKLMELHLRSDFLKIEWLLTECDNLIAKQGDLKRDRDKLASEVAVLLKSIQEMKESRLRKILAAFRKLGF
ncbi:MAG TPA: class I SAM-dependent methyltransferase [Xanthobacteraceae bacterium]|nr:class I SAM-dependent methyltransferase [Xanthobacteraceae bacterium]